MPFAFENLLVYQKAVTCPHAGRTPTSGSPVLYSPHVAPVNPCLPPSVRVR